MARLDLAVLTDLGAQLAAWEEQYVSQAGYEKYRRACAWTVSEAAKGVAGRMAEAMLQVLDRPTPWMLRAWQYTRALKPGGSVPTDPIADVFALDEQSVVLKLLMGDGPNVRMPGDVGLAKDRILVPNWKRLKSTQGISPNKNGNLPGGVMARLAREAGGTVAKRTVRGRWGVYKGEIPLGGSRIMGYIARPPREKRPEGKGGRLVLRNIGRPRLLLAAIPQATYRPILQVAWEAAQADALNRIPDLMASELAKNLEHQEAKGWAVTARELNAALADLQARGVAGREGEARTAMRHARSLLASVGR